jgi:hypothetical protein
MSCLSHEEIVAYWAGEGDSDAVEEHIFACDPCAALAERVAAITELLRSVVPPIVTQTIVDSLRARGHRMDDNFVQPGERSRVLFSTQNFIIHHLQGLDLADAERVSVSVLVDETDHVLVDAPDAPFEREAGEVLIACQRHYAAFPPNVRFEVKTLTKAGAARTTSYIVEHEFRLA